MRVKTWLVVVLLSVIVLIIGAEVFITLKESRKLGADQEKLQAKAEALINDNNQIEKEIRYYSFSESIEKFLREKFNYKKPGEKMIIVVPDQTR